MKVCYFGTYDPDYLRNRIIRKGLESNGIDVIQCRAEYTRWPGVYLTLFLKWITLEKKEIEIILVGENGFIIMPLAWLLGHLWHKNVILDAFFSCHDAEVFDRKIVRENSLEAGKLFLVEYFACRLAWRVLLDTKEHIKRFSEKYGLREDKFLCLPVGADDTVFSPAENKSGERQGAGIFKALFWGTFIPLHGIEYIIRAAKILEKENDVKFYFIGGGQTYDEMRKLSDGLRLENTVFLQWRGEANLAEEIRSADICLGIFGDTIKTQLVVPHKAFQALATSKPLVTADTLAAREVLKNDYNAVLCRAADPGAIAESILRLKRDQRFADEIAGNGYKTFKDNYTPAKIIKEFIGKI